MEDGREEIGEGSFHTSDLRHEAKPPSLSSLPSSLSSLVVFVDEIDAVRSLPFSADEFFAGIRECYNRRASDAAFRRLTFCLVGVATPSDLIQDTRISPFNIGRRIELHDFTPDEVRSLAAGFPQADAPLLLQRVLHWTNGHPYLTQRLCQAIAEQREAAFGVPPSRAASLTLVDSVCARLFLSKAAQETDDNLAFVRSRLLRSETDVASLLDLYLQVQRGRAVRDDETNPLCGVLRLSGVTKAERGVLRSRCRIYERVFNRAWVLANLPGAEVRRQKRAFQLGVLRGAAVFGGVGVVGSVLLFAALVNARHARRAEQQAHLQEQRAHLQEQRANAQTVEAQRQLYFADMRVVQSEWENGNLEHVRALLEEADVSEQRRWLGWEGWEWRYWSRLAHRPAQTFDVGSEPVFARLSANHRLALLPLSPDLTAQGNPLHVVDVRTGSMAKYVGCDFTYGMCFDWSPDGTRLWCCQGTRVHDALSGQTLLRTRPGEERIVTVRALPDGTGLLTVSKNNKMGRWDFQSRRYVWRHTVPKPGSSLAVGCRFVVGREGLGHWFVYRLRDGVQEHALDATLKLFAASPMAFSSNDRILAGEGRNGGLLLLDTRTGKIALPLGTDRTLRAIAFTPDNATLVAAFLGGVQAWNWRTQRKINDFKVMSGQYTSYTIEPSGRHAATGYKNTISIWDVNAPQEPRICEVNGKSLWGVVYSPNSRVVAACSDDGNIYRWNTASGNRLPTLAGNGKRLSGLAWSHNGRWIASACIDGTVCLWDAQAGQRIGVLHAHAQPVNSVCFRADDRQLLTGSDDASATLWNLRVGTDLQGKLGCRMQPYRTLRGHRTTVESVAFSPDGTRLLTGSDDHSAKLWDARTGALLQTFPLKNEVWSVAFSPDGCRAIFAVLNNTAELWDLTQNRCIRVLRGHTNWVVQACFSPDGRRILTTSRDGTARLWEASSERELLALKGHEYQVNSVRFSPDGNQVATAGEDGTLRLWNASPKQ